MTTAEGGPLARLVAALDAAMDGLARVFLWAANLCLFLMLAMTAATIVLRPLGLSFYWLWPWSMQVFVWMSFIGFFVIYRLRKDIAVDFVMRRLGPWAMTASRYLVAVIVLAVMSVMLWEMPLILRQQVGVIDGVVTPWGWELERYTLSAPLAVSCALIFLSALLEIVKAAMGWPEPITHYAVGDE